MHAILLLTLPLSFSQPSPAQSAPAPSARQLYRAAVAHARDRAQAELVRTTDLWVDHTSWENPWVFESEHFQVRTTHGAFLAAAIAKDAEYMLGEITKVLGPAPVPARKFRVWVFPSLTAYNEFGAGAGNGDEHSSMYGAFHSSQHPDSPAATYYTPNRTLLGMWITHAIVHQYLQQTFGRQVPVWIDEGLASYFALYWDWSFGARELRRITTSPAYVPLEVLTRDSIKAYVDNSDVRFIELGMLFHYLLNIREETRTSAETDTGPFRDFLRAVVRGKDISMSPFARMSTQELSRIEQDFKSVEFGAQ